MVAPRVYHGEYTLQETVILTQLNVNMQARDLERIQFVDDFSTRSGWEWARPMVHFLHPT